MHYIRLLRPAKLLSASKSPTRPPTLSVLVTVTTDLGDAFLSPAPEHDAIDLAVTARDPAGADLLLPPPPPPDAGRRRFAWKAGMRVLELRAPLLRPGVSTADVEVCVFALPPKTTQGPRQKPAGDDGDGGGGALRTGALLPWRPAWLPAGVIVPASTRADAATRALRFDCACAAGAGGRILRFEEELGDSLARHVWDAGVVASAFLDDACCASGAGRLPGLAEGDGDAVRVLELGAGVGILGLSVAASLQYHGKSGRKVTALLTDLPDAEERARRNIARALALYDAEVPALEYEDLDWDDAREGRFGPLVSADSWDLVVLSDCTYNVDSLPALVGTLSALQHREGQGPLPVLLAMKPRHASEEALWGLLDQAGWEYECVKTIPLRKIGAEEEQVKIYLLRKGGGREG
ncbi:putative methyltransferase-domain-containing protein [Xylariomycetidae sp. FL0641]|nr:putative methyltransferase-domain-containing protein [Xylariomycetidae sp. FL0641]